MGEDAPGRLPARQAPDRENEARGAASPDETMQENTIR